MFAGDLRAVRRAEGRQVKSPVWGPSSSASGLSLPRDHKLAGELTCLHIPAGVPLPPHPHPPPVPPASPSPTQELPCLGEPPLLARLQVEGEGREGPPLLISQLPREAALQPLETQDLQEARDSQEAVACGATFWEQLLEQDPHCRDQLAATPGTYSAPGLSRGSHVGQTPGWPGSQNGGSRQPSSCARPTPSGLPLRTAWARSRRGGDPVAEVTQTQKQLGLRPLGPVPSPQCP